MIRQTQIDLPPFPKLIFFDSNVVQNLYSFSELIYEHACSEEIELKIISRGPRFSDDIFALEYFVALGLRIGWPIAISDNVLNEIQASNRPELVSWGSELAQYCSGLEIEDERYIYGESRHFTFIQRSQLSEILKDLPQESDRQLVIDAKEYGCDIFLTMDYRTIWDKRECVSPLGIKVMRPVELVEYIQPWAGLLA